MRLIDGEPWFVGKDICIALGYRNDSDALSKHCRGVAKRYPIVDGLGRTQEMSTEDAINEIDVDNRGGKYGGGCISGQ